jgi:hypothetical protein|tara:strand:+ start:2028 stop:2261 length:234 start_codon:yes stop_codon:yes gene_type:complete
MDKVRLRVGDLVRKWRQSVLETGILLKRHEAKSFETDCDVVVWDIHGWTKPKRAIESAIKKGIEEGRIQYTSVRNEK